MLRLGVGRQSARSKDQRCQSHSYCLMKQGTHDNPPQFTFGQMINNPLQLVLNSIAMNMPTRIGPAFSLPRTATPTIDVRL
jgi:hypothetical protein